MFDKVLIANRGEIAIRIARSVQAAGMKAIAVFSDPDHNAPHVTLCDASVSLAGNTAAQTYLDIKKIVEAAKTSGAEAVHPGYGFLSENADFARACEDAGLVFIGPSPNAIELMGNKRAAKIAVSDVDVPCIPGYEGADQSDTQLLAQAQSMGYPIMVKAAAGGGGRGMRVVQQASDFAASVKAARSEARSAFGSDELILERVITGGRHIEIQIAADKYGNCVYLGERDCSLQRRHQKVIEEAPSPFVDNSLREAMGQAAVKVAQCCDYSGVGTVEFLVAEDRSFYFLEMNTRLQVEHPVTELITDIDLVDWQLRIAAEEPLPKQQNAIQLTGHAIEARLYAEDPLQDFIPQTGRILKWLPANDKGIRIDDGIQSGMTISPYYDSMLAKIIASGDTREQARRRLVKALETSCLLGISSNQAFLKQLLQETEFITGNATTASINEQVIAKAKEAATLNTVQVALACVLLLRELDPQPPYFQNWSNAPAIPRSKCVLINEQEYKVVVTASGNSYQLQWQEQLVTIAAQSNDGDTFIADVDRTRYVLRYAYDKPRLYLAINGKQLQIEDASYRPAQSTSKTESGRVVANTDGQLVALSVSQDEKVVAGQLLAVVEAMKMEHRLVSDIDGIVSEIHVSEGSQVKKNQLLIGLSHHQDLSPNREEVSA